MSQKTHLWDCGVLVQQFKCTDHDPSRRSGGGRSMTSLPQIASLSFSKPICLSIRCPSICPFFHTSTYLSSFNRSMSGILVSLYPSFIHPPSYSFISYHPSIHPFIQLSNHACVHSSIYWPSILPYTPPIHCPFIVD